jgi:GT2 family glycosyltransferase
MSDFEFIIKTHERPEVLSRLLYSIRVHYPETIVRVADDSKDYLSENAHVCGLPGVLRYELPHNKGLSFGRNFLVGSVVTPYFVLLDDDFILRSETKVEALLELLRLQRRNGFDLVGGAVRNGGRIRHYQGFIEQVGDVLHCAHHEESQYPVPCEVVWNFFAARTDVIRRVRWDDRQKLGEHLDFFMRCKEAGVRVGYHPGVVIDHDPIHPPGYAAMKGKKALKYRNLFMARRGISEIKGSLASNDTKRKEAANAGGV